MTAIAQKYFFLKKCDEKGGKRIDTFKPTGSYVFLALFET